MSIAKNKTLLAYATRSQKAEKLVEITTVHREVLLTGNTRKWLQAINELSDDLRCEWAWLVFASHGIAETNDIPVELYVESNRLQLFRQSELTPIHLATLGRR